MRHRDVCSLREGQKFSPGPAFKALPFHCWSLAGEGFGAMCLLLPLAPFLLAVLCPFLWLHELEGGEQQRAQGMIGKIFLARVEAEVLESKDTVKKPCEYLTWSSINCCLFLS